ncbi:adenylate/guanylate cyclase domain-containing protein [Dyella caseinilytica]|uniref:Transcriptional regulator n=1 Tax=Dyella caseinilytica TaxID=1849581 RepID=A0ABX7GYK3_9GAMM|nr:adenylate/guanylate cyclase domain-containing protein [Dyella caseinilytica]QRN55582.1 transcriptional regulator [Dyella caseinilytica]GGA02843.1 transcriptional regulator [Dyella caseinilytica]
MSARKWDETRAAERIQSAIDGLPLKDIEIKPYVRETSLENIPNAVAYRVDGVHLYADILNMKDMLHVTDVEGEICHRRTLRFLNLHYRAVHRILQKEDVVRVDFHNQRLHAVITKPYDEEAKRIHRAIAVGQLIIDVLARTGEDADHPPAKVRIGIDTGKALAVNNGRRGHREPLFLGEPANHAAKRAGGGNATGIYLTNAARLAIGLKSVADEDTAALTREEIAVSQQLAQLSSTVDGVVKDWKEDLGNLPISRFEFSGHTPPFADLDIETLTARNSRRQDACTIYGDIDGFTAYVGRNINDDTKAKHVVRALRVLRSELDAVLHEDFKGRKVRFIGDCIHGLLVEGTAQTTDTDSTIRNMVLSAGGMRSSFNLAIRKLKDAGTDATSLGLQIGFEYGPMTVTRLGVKGELIRCSVSRGVLTAEAEQGRCKGDETAIGALAYKSGADAVRTLFGESRKRKGLDYDTAVKELNAKSEKNASDARSSSSLLKAPSTAAAPYLFSNNRSGPAKPDGFA